MSGTKRRHRDDGLKDCPVSYNKENSSILRAFQGAIGNEDYQKVEELGTEFAKHLKEENYDKEIDSMKLSSDEKTELKHIVRKFVKNKTKETIEQGKTDSQSAVYTRLRFELLARFLILSKQNRLAAECIWGIVAIGLKQFAKEEIGTHLDHHTSLFKFCKALSGYYDSSTLMDKFDIAQSTHSNGFYEGVFGAKSLERRLESACEFDRQLEKIKPKLTEEDRRDLAAKKYNN